MNPFVDEKQKPPTTAPPLKPRGRPIRPLRPKNIPGVMEDAPGRSKIDRVPAGGGYRILRQPHLLDSEE